MNILILGGGGREHALAWAISQHPACDELFCAPGNAGIADVARCVALDPCNGPHVATFCSAESIDLVVIGPEAPLAAGVADDLRNAGVLTFGPSQAAAQLEASKAFTKGVCDAANVPTAGWARFSALAPAVEYVLAQGAPIVVKADGLAAGKGVTVATTVAEAEAALESIFSGEFGTAGAEVVIEEFMAGEEASLFVLTDGEAMLPLAPAQDHKRAFDNDEGPNTGGMGAYSPAPVMTEALVEQVLTEMIAPTLAEMRKRGTPYSGVLYAGVMIENGRARLVEYNARFGDPEIQVLAMRLGAQLFDAILAATNGTLAEMRLNWADDHALTVVMAADGYPGSYDKGAVIDGLETACEGDPLVQIFHAGTAEKDGKIVANGGRVLNITARGATLEEARARAYRVIAKIDWPSGFYRKDIAWRALPI
ncbi:MAG: phosphoribosylamine--glycine ligase [Pseudomonadota bacterium]